MNIVDTVQRAHREMRENMVYVISNFRGYLYVDVEENEHWLRSPFNADKYESKENAERNAKNCSAPNAVVVQLT